MILNISLYGLILNTLWSAKSYAFASSKEASVYGKVFKRQSASIQYDSVPLRRNVLEFQKDRVSLSLFLQALSNLQAREDSDPYSYFQLAGIHGRPFIPWNSRSKETVTYEMGYCTHTLVEKSLIAEAQDIAKSFKNDSAKYLKAANDLRIPYWDWAASPNLPDIATKPKVEIDTSFGVKTIENPLFEYRFHAPLDPQLFPPSSRDGWFSNFNHTVRGLYTKNPDAVSNIDSVNDSLQRANLMANTWRVIVRSKVFNAFGSTATPGLSLEGIHNNIHSSIGGRYGHMGYLSFSAYDPLFWIHHANIDRLFALWQTINPDSYLQPQEDASGNFVIGPHSIVNEDTSLEPFLNEESGQWWTSATARNISTFSYTYPELLGNRTTEELRSSVIAAINQLYNPNNEIRRRTINSERDTSTPISLYTRQWSLEVSVSKFDLGGSRFKVLFFIGGVPLITDEWEQSNNLIGSVVVFPPPNESSSPPLPQLLTYSEIDLDNGLRRNGRDVDDIFGVIEFLQDHLEWRIQKMDGIGVALDQVPSLNITLQDQMMLMPADITQLPTYSEKTSHPDALTAR